MKKCLLTLTAVLIAMLLIMGCCTSAFAQSDGVEIRISLRNRTVEINGRRIDGPAPMISGSSLLVPADLFSQAFGAEVDYKEKGSVSLIYRDVEIDMTAGSDRCMVNQAEKPLPSPVQVYKGATMVPFRFIAESLGATVEYNAAAATALSVMKDDGALTDLSILTDSITKPRAGNSYFGWSINVPGGSRIANSTFNSKYVSIENEHRGVSLEISADLNNGKTLSDYYSQINENPRDYVDSDTITESGLNQAAGQPYAEFVYNNSNDEVVYHRIYVNLKYVYHVILTSYNQSNPQIVKENQYYMGILNSFSLTYKGGSKDVQDLSKVKFGLTRYGNYITFDNSNKYFTWEISVMPEWEILNSYNGSPLRTRLGLKRGEYMDIEISKSDGRRDIETLGNNTKDFYDRNFNPALYTFIGKTASKVSDYDSAKLVFSVTTGKKKCIYSENYISAGGLNYDIILRLPEDVYNTKKDAYEKMLETFKATDKDTAKLIKDIDDYIYSQERNRVGKTDSPAEYQNKQYKWTVKVPGNWMKDKSADGNVVTFNEPVTGMSASIETIENTSQNRTVSDEEKFKLIASMANREDVAFKGKSSSGGQNMIYKYRWENENDEIFADVEFHTYNGEKYSYCLAAVIPDEFGNNANTKTISDIVASFATQ